MFNVLHIGMVNLKYPLPGTEQIIKEEKFHICLPSVCLLSCRFVNIGSLWSNIRCTFPPSDCELSVLRLYRSEPHQEFFALMLAFSRYVLSVLPCAVGNITYCLLRY